MTPSLLFRYTALHVANGVVLALLVIFAMIVLVDFVELSRTVGSGTDASAFTLAGLAFLRAPLLVETTLPFIFLFGTMWGMFRLNRSSELVVMRAAGLSAWRFVAPCAVLAIVSGVVATTMLNPAAARLSEEFERQRERLENPGQSRLGISEEALWLREAHDDAQFVLRASGSSDGGRLLEEVTLFIYGFDRLGEPVFQRRVDGERAELRGGFWQITDAWEIAPDEPAIRHATISFPTNIDPNRLLERFGSPKSLNFWELPRQASRLRSAGFSSVDFDLRWYRLMAAPLSLAAMSILAAAVALRLARRGGAFMLAVTGAGLGFGLFFTENMLAALGSTGVLPLPVAAWAAPSFALLGGLLIVSILEDG